MFTETTARSDNTNGPKKAQSSEVGGFTFQFTIRLSVIFGFWSKEIFFYCVDNNSEK